ncbi:hypothetical protein [Gloeothece verrucosa]|uniref:Uncharacterized protein n=1 Tax=Gloeothece verrucosa (strain PCC 7822) TaxID=497965 RepID=E0UN74_GLOV7|nr:hypothetical protein [Gloeothece verrucosa]ADN18404.1 conserved hypothetical protein [Gloeothece verrucosa PCC 7822]
MTGMPTFPDPEQIQQTLTKAHRNCQEMELAGIELEEVIVLLEQEIRRTRRKHLGKMLEQESS